MDVSGLQAMWGIRLHKSQISFCEICFKFIKTNTSDNVLTKTLTTMTTIMMNNDDDDGDDDEVNGDDDDGLDNFYDNYKCDDYRDND